MVKTGGNAICVRYGLSTFSGIVAVSVLVTTLTGIFIVNAYIISQNSLAASLHTTNLDTIARLNVLTAADVALTAADVALYESLTLVIQEGDTSVLSILTTINASITSDVSYLSALLNVTSGSALSFTQLVDEQLQAGLAARLRSVNDVVGDNVTLNVNIVSLSPDTLSVVPDAGTNSVGLLMSGVVSSAQGTVIETIISTTTIQVDTLNVTLTTVVALLAEAQAAIAVLQTQVENATITAMPVGAILPWSGALATAPTGYLLCDGSTYEQADYAALFAVIGNVYGGGGTNFTVPDLRGKMPVGHSESGAFNVDIGTGVGEETHVLVETEMPAHTHNATTSTSDEHSHGGFTTAAEQAHQHYMEVYNTVTACTGGAGVGFSSNNINTCGNGAVVATIRTADDVSTHRHYILGDGAHSHTLDTSSAGSGTAHNVIQPSIVLQYIVKH
jgi:microcystin-dependent protein